jgi:hypothetical protein
VTCESQRRLEENLYAENTLPLNGERNRLRETVYSLYTGGPTPAVTEPAAMLMLGSGLLWFWGARKKSKK